MRVAWAGYCPIRTFNLFIPADPSKLFFIVFMALGLDTMRFGAGLHQWDVSIRNAMRFGEVRLSLSPRSPC